MFKYIPADGKLAALPDRDGRTHFQRGAGVGGGGVGIRLRFSLVLAQKIRNAPRYVEPEVTALQRQAAVERLDIVHHHLRVFERNRSRLKIERTDVEVALRNRERKISEVVNVITRNRDGFGLGGRSFFVGFISRGSRTFAGFASSRFGLERLFNLDRSVLVIRVAGDRERPDCEIAP